MGILDVLAQLAGGGPSAKAWALKNNDTGQEILGQYLPQNYTEGASANISETSTVNQQDPFQQWTGGNTESSSFDVRIFAYSSESTVLQDVQILKDATKKDEQLNRPPIFTFKYGVDIAYTCFVESVKNIKYDEFRADGTIRGATLSITLRKIENLPATDPSGLSELVITGKQISDFFENSFSDIIDVFGASPHKKSRTIKAKEGDTFESIAAREYGNALVGDILRRAQPDKVNLKPGDDVILIDDVEIFQIKVQPLSPPLQRNPISKAVRDQKFEARNRTGLKIL